MALQLHINVSLNRPPGRTWRRPPGRPRNKWLDQIPPVQLESSGGVLSTVDMVVQRRDGPCRLRDHDDDDDDDVSGTATERSTERLLAADTITSRLPSAIHQAVVYRSIHECRVLNTLSDISVHHCHHLSPPHSFIPRLKPSFSPNPSHRSLPFLLQDWLHGFPGLFTDTSGHIRFFYFLGFLPPPLFCCWFRAVD